MSLEQAKIKNKIQCYSVGFSDGFTVGVIATTILAMVIWSFV